MSSRPCRFLSVHDDRDSDNADGGAIRVIVQPFLSQATVWELSVEQGKEVLTIVSNPGPAGEGTLGRFLTIAEDPYRSSESFYLAVTGDPHRAIDVRPIAESTCMD